MDSFIRNRADAITNIFNSGNVDSILDLYCEDAKFSDYILRAVNLDKAATHAFYTHLMTSHPGTKFITRNVTGTNEFVAHEMTIELRAGDDLKELGAKKGQLVRFNGVSLQSWQKQGHETSASNEDVANWKILEQKEYFYVEEVLDE